MIRSPVPPFTEESAREKVQFAEDSWNSCDPERVALAYSSNCIWRNRDIFLNGRIAIIDFLTIKWANEHEYRLIKELFAFGAARIAVRFAYEWHDRSGVWFRSYGNENWEFNPDGLMTRRLASINDTCITAEDRLFRWPKGQRPNDHPGLSALGL